MTNIKSQIAELRTWFMNTSAPNAQVKSNYLKILNLLIEGEKHGLKIGAITCGALHELLAGNLGRINKIHTPDKILWTGEPYATAEELYSIVREMVLIHLADV